VAGDQMTGTIQTLQCRREERVCWEKMVYVPNNELEKFYDRYRCKRVGVFVYDVIGLVQVVKRKPINTPHWNE
jgi:hypothetical protein